MRLIRRDGESAVNNVKEYLMDSQSAKTIADFLITDFHNEMQTTERILTAVPLNRLDYRPDQKAKTGLGLVRHLALEDEWLLNCIANGVFTPPPMIRRLRHHVPS